MGDPKAFSEWPALMIARFYSRCMKTVRELLDLLIANPDIHVGEHVSDDAESFTGVSTCFEIGLFSV